MAQLLKNNFDIKYYDPSYPWKIANKKYPIPSELDTKQDVYRIGEKSAYGAVYKIGNDDKYVLKLMIFKDYDYIYESNFNIFMNEVEVGSVDNIEKAGPRIYKYFYNKYGGLYIMDNVLKGRKDHIMMTLDKYLRNEYGFYKCPSADNPLYSILRETLINFYNITKGYHGDLHGNNIMIVIDGDKKIVDIKIIDYGAHRKFKNTTESDCLETLFNRIDKEWNKSPNTVMKKAPHVKDPINAQPYRKNPSVLNFFGNEFMDRLKNIPQEKLIYIKNPSDEYIDFNKVDKQPEIIPANMSLFKSACSAPETNNNDIQNLYKKIIEEITNNNTLYIIGYGYGGSMISKVAKILQKDISNNNVSDNTIKKNLHIFTINSYYIAPKKFVENIQIINFVSNIKKCRFYKINNIDVSELSNIIYINDITTIENYKTLIEYLFNKKIIYNDKLLTLINKRYDTINDFINDFNKPIQNKIQNKNNVKKNNSSKSSNSNTSNKSNNSSPNNKRLRINNISKI